MFVGRETARKANIFSSAMVRVCVVAAWTIFAWFLLPVSLAFRQGINFRLRHEPIRQSSQLHLILEPDLLSSSLSVTTTLASLSPEPIHTAFSVATFLPQPFWLLMILLPNSDITKRIMGGLGRLSLAQRVPAFHLTIDSTPVFTKKYLCSVPWSTSSLLWHR